MDDSLQGVNCSPNRGISISIFPQVECERCNFAEGGGSVDGGAGVQLTIRTQ